MDIRKLSILLDQAQKELEVSKPFLKVKELESLILKAKIEEHTFELKQELLDIGYECRNINTNYSIEINMINTDNSIEDVSHLNYIIVSSDTSEIDKLSFSNESDLVIFKDGTERLLSDVVIGIGCSKLKAWSNAYINLKGSIYNYSGLTHIMRELKLN